MKFLMIPTKSKSNMRYSYLFLAISIFAFSCSSKKNSNNVDDFDTMAYRGADRVETLLSNMIREFTLTGQAPTLLVDGG